MIVHPAERREVHVRELRDAEAGERTWQAGDGDVDLPYVEPRGLDPDRVGAGRDRGAAEGAQEAAALGGWSGHTELDVSPGGARAHKPR